MDIEVWKLKCKNLNDMEFKKVNFKNLKNMDFGIRNVNYKDFGV